MLANIFIQLLVITQCRLLTVPSKSKNINPGNLPLQEVNRSNGNTWTPFSSTHGHYSQQECAFKPTESLTTVLPCLMKPSLLAEIPTQSLTNLQANSTDYIMQLEVQEGGIAYLPCGTMRELVNETVIWEQNTSTIAVMGTLFTMNARIDVAGIRNKLRKCPLSRSEFPAYHSEFSSLSDDRFQRYKLAPDDVIQMWELVISDARPEDNGLYVCRLTGRHPQLIQYQVNIKKSALVDLNTSTRLLKIDAPKYVRKGFAAVFTCSMKTTYENSSRILIDWFRIGSKSNRDSAMSWRKSNLVVNYPNLIESQPWNNISVYKQIMGESNDRLVIETVLVIQLTDYIHTATYECQAHEMHGNDRSHIYDSLSFDFKVLPRWQYYRYLDNSYYCPDITNSKLDSVSSNGGKLVVLSDSPIKKHRPNDENLSSGPGRSRKHKRQHPYKYPKGGSANAHFHSHLAVLLILLLFLNCTRYVY